MPVSRDPKLLSGDCIRPPGETGLPPDGPGAGPGAPAMPPNDPKKCTTLHQFVIQISKTVQV